MLLTDSQCLKCAASLLASVPGAARNLNDVKRSIVFAVYVVCCPVQLSDYLPERSSCTGIADLSSTTLRWTGNRRGLQQLRAALSIREVAVNFEVKESH